MGGEDLLSEWPLHSILRVNCVNWFFPFIHVSLMDVRRGSRSQLDLILDL